MRLAISPALAALNPADSVLQNTVFLGYFSLKANVYADRLNLFLSKLCGSASLATISSSMANLVRMIILAGIPPKITKVVVLWVTVIVTAFHFTRSLSNESLHHKRVRLPILWFVVFPEKHKKATVLLIERLGFYFSGQFRANAALVRNLVKPFKAGNIAPYFHNYPHTYTTGIV